MAKALKMFLLVISALCYWSDWVEGQTFSEQPIVRLGKGAIEQVAYSPDGTLLAVAGNVGCWLYDTHSLTEVGVLEKPGYPMAHVAFSPDGKILAAGSGSSIVLWDLAQRKEMAVLEGHTHGVSAIMFSPDGTLLASGGEDATVRLWDVAQRKEIASFLDFYAYKVTSVAFSPDGKLLVSGGVTSEGCLRIDNEVHLWDVIQHQKVGTLGGGQAISLVFSPDGTMLAAGCDDGNVHLWDMAQRQEIAILKGPSSLGECSSIGVRSVAFSPDGTLIASGSYDGTLRLWDTEQYKEIAVLNAHTWLDSNSGVISVAFSPNGKILATGGDYVDQTVRLWDIEQRKQIAIIEGFTRSVGIVTFSPDGKLLASGSWDGSVLLWDVVQCKEIDNLPVGGEVRSVAFSPDGTLLAAVKGTEVLLWDMVNMQKATVLQVQNPVEQNDIIYSIAFSPDGKLLASGSLYDNIRLWDVEQRQLVATLTKTSKKAYDTNRIYSLAFSPDGRLLVSGSGKDVRLWDVTDRQTVFEISVGVPSVAFCSDGSLLALVSWDGTVRIWSVPQRREVAILRGHRNGVNAVAFSHDGKLLASGSSDGTVLLWEVKPTAVEDAGHITEEVLQTPKTFTLYQNYPNPFNTATTIEYELPVATDVSLVIYDLAGRKIRTLVQGYQQQGHHTIVWDGQDEKRQAVASGVYCYRLTANSFTQTRKMLLIR